MFGILEQEPGEETGYLVNIQVIGIAQCAVYIETEGFDAWNIKWHTPILPRYGKGWVVLYFKQYRNQ